MAYNRATMDPICLSAVRRNPNISAPAILGEIRRQIPGAEVNIKSLYTHLYRLRKHHGIKAMPRRKTGPNRRETHNYDGVPIIRRP